MRLTSLADCYLLVVVLCVAAALLGAALGLGDKDKRDKE